MRRVLKLVWASPGSLVGVGLSLLFRRRYVRRGILVCEGADWPRRLGWPYRAITFGHVVLSVDALDEPTFHHELVHVRQFERWGPLFIPVYLLASVEAMWHGGHHYRDNRFELEAKRPAHRAPGDWLEVVNR